MKLLILAQAVDTEDPVLGFFVRWIEELAKRVEHIEVICLKEGSYSLPDNVRVHSLGKEKGVSHAKYVLNFYTYIWRLRYNYNAVFIHMNQEYSILGGLFWRLLGKRVYLWRNYHTGNILTDIAMVFCTKVFCTSRHSYTARNKKTDLMPVGVDTERFFSDARTLRKPRSVLFLSGMWPSKRPELLIDALALLHKEGIAYTADIYGSPLPETKLYYESLKQRAADAGLTGGISFHAGVPNTATPDLYRAHEIFVNCSPSGMFDKTLFEAAACGCTVLAVSEDFASLAGRDFQFDSAETLAVKLASILGTPRPLPAPLVAGHSLAVLAGRLVEAIH